MKLKDAIEGISENLSIVLNKIIEIEDYDLSANDMVAIQSIKERMVSCSKLILSIADNQDSINKDYIVYEIKTAQKFCVKSINILNEIEERMRK